MKAAIFDLGGVLFTDGTKRFLEYLETTYHVDPSRAKPILSEGELANLYREGKIERGEYWGKVREMLQLPENMETLETNWINGYELIPETRDIIFELKNNYGVYFLSDNVAERVRRIDEKFNFISWFDGGVFSHEVGMRKPNPKIYERALEVAQVRPTEALFIDDKASALVPASRMGMQTILFESPVKLRTQLIERGLLGTHIERPTFRRQKEN